MGRIVEVQVLSYDEFFTEVVGHPPYPYQRRLPIEDVSLVDIPTGLGKTAAVVVAWLYSRLTKPSETPRRLVYCLPMRALVSQVLECCGGWVHKARAEFDREGQKVPRAHVLMGGYLQEDWERRPERSAILVGTQDMLLSRALNRGYDMSRFRWPMHFGLLNNDAFWVFDEPQVMGVAVETGAQLQAFRDRLGTSSSTKSLWMSATLDRGQLATIDQVDPPEHWPLLELSEADLKHEGVKNRLNGLKVLHQEPIGCHGKDDEKSLAKRIAEVHREGSLTLVVLNQVERAQAVYRALRAHLATGKGRSKRYPEHVLLLHSRFRPLERRRIEARLIGGQEELIAIATQVVEAGLDIDADTLITELCPWPSFVQRAGRCNRRGELDEGGQIYWIDLDEDTPKQSAPYSAEELSLGRRLLREQGDDASPHALAQSSREKYRAPHVIRPVLRRKDLLSLFDTTPDLMGDDVDVSRFVRDTQDNGVSVYWRAFERVDGLPADDCPPERDEICRVPLAAFDDFLSKKLKAHNEKQKPQQRRSVWTWDPLDSGWKQVHRARPGWVVMLPVEIGGYLPDEGWTGKVDKDPPFEAIQPPQEQLSQACWEGIEGDGEAELSQWIPLAEHLEHVRREARGLLEGLTIPVRHGEAVVEGALWHDVGKAHREGFQAKLAPREDTEELWAKSPFRTGSRSGRPYFRHELASALAWHQCHPEHPQRDLIAYLIAAHHGKIRLSIRALAQEQGDPEAPQALFARGVWQGDVLDAFTMPDGQLLEGIALDLSMMRMGEGSWLERCLALRDDPELGPFRLAYLETLLRVADWRASADEASQNSKPNQLLSSPPAEETESEEPVQLSLFGKGGGR